MVFFKKKVIFYEEKMVFLCFKTALFTRPPKTVGFSPLPGIPAMSYNYICLFGVGPSVMGSTVAWRALARGQKERRSNKMLKERCVLGLCCRVGFCLFIVLFLSVAAFAVPVKIYVDIDGGGADLTVPSGIDWDIVYANPSTKYTWYGDNGGTGWSLGGMIKVNSVSITVRAANPADPDALIELGYAVQAGGNIATTFTIWSDELSLGIGLTNAQGRAFATTTVPVPGRTIIGGYDPEIYRAIYNGSDELAQLIDGPRTGPGTWEETADWQAIPGTVTSMQSEWKFTLSASPVTSSSGTSSYKMVGDIIPEPASVFLLSLGSLGLLKRRRK